MYTGQGLKTKPAPLKATNVVMQDLSASYRASQDIQARFARSAPSACKKGQNRGCKVTLGSSGSALDQYAALLMATSPSSYSAQSNAPLGKQLVPNPVTQGICSTCVASAVTAAAEMAVATVLQIDVRQVDLSEMDMHYCDKRNPRGCRTGANLQVTQFDLYSDFEPFFNKTANKHAIYRRLPNSTYKEGHAVLLIGYHVDLDPLKSYWLALNSFGPNWADGGRFRMEFDYPGSSVENAYGVKWTPTTSPIPFINAKPAPGAPDCCLYKATQGDYLSKVARTAKVDITTLIADNTNALPQLNASLAGKTLLVCSKRCPDAAMYESLLWPTLQVTSGKVTFIGVCRPKGLPLRQANIKFAAAYCQQKGGVVAYWNTRQEYSDLSRLAIKIRQECDLWDTYIGLVQLEGFDEPEGGWVWQHDGSRPASNMQWRDSEPNNFPYVGDEDCAVLTPGDNGADPGANMVADFPCDSRKDDGTWRIFAPEKVTLACRIAS
eukprot:gene10898-11052_t